VDFNQMIDFCVWTLECDGLQVPPFNRHLDGDHALRDAGITAANWSTWFSHVVALQQEPVPPLEMLEVTTPRINAAAAWEAEAAVAERLNALWASYGSAANERRGTIEMILLHARVADRLWNQLRPYHTSLDTLYVHLVRYTVATNRIMLPHSVIHTVPGPSIDPDLFCAAVMEEAHRLSSLRH